MGNLKQKINQMLKLMKTAGIANLKGSLDTCDWEGTAYYRYMPFNGASEIIEHAKHEDVCLVIGGLQFIVADIDNSKHIDKCEFSLMCIGTGGFGEVDTSDWDPESKEGHDAWVKLGTECAKHSVSFGWPDVEKACADTYGK